MQRRLMRQALLHKRTSCPMSIMHPMPDAEYFGDESHRLELLLGSMKQEDFRVPTAFKGWTYEKILRHLHVWNMAAFNALDNEQALKAFLEEAMPAVFSLTLPRFEEACLGGLSGLALFQAWREFYPKLAERFALADPAARLSWAGPGMSARSCITARYMETWAHAQAIYDSMGRVRSNSDSIKSIVVLGLNTYGWTFVNRSLPVPEPRPMLRLEAPSGAMWTFGDADSLERVEGDAVEFCQVITQTRNLLDTKLNVSGENASAWMRIAQCFAGPPVDPPRPGERLIAGRLS